MKKITLLFTLLLISSTTLHAQDINVSAANFDDAANMNGGVGLGFMNVSNRPAPCDNEAAQFNSGWGVVDLISEVNIPGNTITLKPNRINVQDDYWQQGPPGGPFTMLEGNKYMDASHYIEDDALLNSSFTFNGEVLSNTLNSAGLCTPFIAEAFIKVFNSDYSILEQHIKVPLNVGLFQLEKTVNGSAGGHVQYGFEVFGANINSDPSFDAAYNALGSIVITENSTLSVNNVVTADFKAYPNPTKSEWTITSNNQIQSIEVYDILGKLVITQEPNDINATINAALLSNGVYIAKINAANGETNIRLIKE